MSPESKINHPNAKIQLPEGLNSVKRVTAAELTTMAETCLSKLGGGDSGVFAYGSLIWHPPFVPKYNAHARIFGFSRKPCVLSTTYRGTADVPGPVYGLDEGGSCNGLVLGLPKRGRRQALLALFTREMFLNTYRPKIVVAHHRAYNSRRTVCLTFVVNRASPQYLSYIPPSQLREMVHRAKGERGTCYEYWRQTIDYLRKYDIRWRLGEHVIRGA